MSDLTVLMTDKLVPLKEKGLKILSDQHPIIYTALDTFLKGKISKIGFQVTDREVVIATYTIVLNGIHIVQVDAGSLDPSVSFPLWGEFKPYAIMEKDDLEKALEDKEMFVGDVLKNAMKYLPMVTLRFLP